MGILNQLIASGGGPMVYWAPGAPDRYGKPSLASPIQFAGRWEDGIHETLSSESATVLASAKIFTNKPMRVNGMLMQGSLTTVNSSGFPADPRQSASVREILNVESIPALRGGEVMIVAHVV